MMLEVSHRTTYSYGRPVLRSPHLVYIAAAGSRQAVHRHGLLIEPAPSGNVSVEDYFGNRSAVLTIEERHELVIRRQHS
jgi:transglutaminase-like putative cysteine protease